jgi:hypothetical protein
MTIATCPYFRGQCERHNRKKFASMGMNRPSCTRLYYTPCTLVQTFLTQGKHQTSSCDFASPLPATSEFP